MQGYQQGEGGGRKGWEGTGNKWYLFPCINGIYTGYKWQVGEVRNSIGNGEAKELTCMTHGHEPRWGMLLGEGCRAQGNKEEKKMG